MPGRLGLTFILFCFLASGCTTTAPSQKDADGPEPPHLVGSPGLSPPEAPSGEPSGAVPDDAKPTATAPDRRGALWYRIELSKTAIDVHVRLLRPPARTTFFLPGVWNRHGEGIRDEHIHLGSARGPEGTLPTRRIVPQHRIDVDTEGQPWVQLDYRVPLRDPAPKGRFAPRLEGSTLLSFAPALLVVPSERLVRHVRDIPVEVHAPNDWTMLSTWRRVHRKASGQSPDHTVHGFLARDFRELRDAYVAAGPKLAKYRRHREDDRISVGFTPDFDQGRRAVIDAVEKVVEFYRRQFGHVGPVSVFVRADPAAGRRARRGSGRRGGFVLEMPPGAPDRVSQLLIAHEAFHLWNGHRLVPAPDAERATRWFKEGATHYIALKAVHALGFFGARDVRREIARAAYLYRHNPAARGPHARGVTDIDRHRLPYDRGLLLALALDGALHASSGGELGIEHWFRRLLREVDGGPDRMFNTDTLHETLMSVAPSTCTACHRLWKNHIRRGAPLNVSGALGEAGLHLLEGPGASQTRATPLRGAAVDFNDLLDILSP